MGQNWSFLNGARVMNEIADCISRNNMVIIYRSYDGDGGDDREDEMTYSHLPHPDMYPWAGFVARSSCACVSTECRCVPRIIWHQALHLMTWDLLRGATNPRRPGEVVHHRNEDKHDARLKNLGKGTRAAHARAHRMRRRKFSYRERINFGGFRHRPHQPARVESRPEMIGMVVPAAPRRPPTKNDLVKEMLRRLGGRWVSLSDELAHLDSGMPIPRGPPRAAWMDGKTRMLGLKMPRLKLFPGEAVFVLLAVKHKFDLDSVATDAGERRALLESLMKRTAVSVAIERWHKQKRLPLAQVTLTDRAAAHRGT